MQICCSRPPSRIAGRLSQPHQAAHTSNLRPFEAPSRPKGVNPFNRSSFVGRDRDREVPTLRLTQARGSRRSASACGRRRRARRRATPSPPRSRSATATSTPRASTATRPTSAPRSATAASRASEIFVTTKLWNDDQGYDEALRAFDASLAAARARLRRSLSDPLARRRASGSTRGARSSSFRREKRARSIGVSNYLVPHLEELLGAGEARRPPSTRSS